MDFGVLFLKFEPFAIVTRSWFDKLTMNGNSAGLGIDSLFTLSLSKGENDFCQRLILYLEPAGGGCLKRASSLLFRAGPTSLPQRLPISMFSCMIFGIRASDFFPSSV